MIISIEILYFGSNNQKNNSKYRKVVRSNPATIKTLAQKWKIFVQKAKCINLLFIGDYTRFLA